MINAWYLVREVILHDKKRNITRFFCCKKRGRIRKNLLLA